jgi:predicted O-methyltransferase YrrM
MLGIPLRYLLKHPISTVADIARDPRQTWATIQDEYVYARERRGPQCSYTPDADWEQRLHLDLGCPWPCPQAAEFWALWPSVIAELEAKGIHAGPESFQAWNDGDAALVRAIWCLTRHLKPKKVVETGVGHGVTSRFILEALARNAAGHLWSIDLPPIDRFWRSQVGAAVGDPQSSPCAARWTLLRGSSRRHLPQLLAQLGEIDLFVHDSLHSARNVRFELDLAWPALSPHGALVVDDVDANWAFHTFTQDLFAQAFPAQQSFIAEAEPLHPDLRRFNQKGLFGIILKPLPSSPLPTESASRSR